MRDFLVAKNVLPHPAKKTVLQKTPPHPPIFNPHTSTKGYWSSH